ncbi:MAG: carboxymuconolactone decarboxylase family protein [Halanaerobium sp.]
MKKFSKRTFRSFSEFIREFKFILKNRDKIGELEKGKLISDQFRQRIMMAVTEVNGCRYCSYYHSKQALKAGISSEELDSLLAGKIKNCPDKEKIALIYAQHWAEKQGKPEQEWKQKLKSEYGAEKAEIINLAVRMINFGNLSGNTFDYLLFKLSFGFFGQ